MDRSHDRPLNAGLPLTLFLLGVASLASDLGSVWIKTPFLRPGVTLGDGIEAAGVYVVLALFLRANRIAGGSGLLAAAATVTFALGHGIHLAGNSAHDLAERSGLAHPDPTGLLGFWDETAGHHLVDLARAAFAVGLLRAGAATAHPSGPLRRAALIVLGGVSYGFITFASSVEGQTVPLVLPFCALLALYGIATARAPRGDASIRRFFLTAAWTALLFFAIWGIWHRGFPEFTRTGILPGAVPHSAFERGAP